VTSGLPIARQVPRSHPRTGVSGAGTSEVVFGALADPTRRQLVDWLSEGGPATATQLALRLPITRQAVVKHLAILAEAGIVLSRREGREVRFRLQPEPLAAAMEWMAALAARWDQRLDALRREVTAPPRSA
jgi:DNA-binding transcriptional ArsR family regulator